MKQFNFKMQTLLRLRKMKEDAALREVSLVQEELNKLFELLKLLNIESTALEEELRDKQKGSIPIHEFHNHFLYIQSIKIKMLEQQDAILHTQNLLEKKRQNVEIAMQNKKVIEKLKDKQYDRWQEDLKKLEVKLLDELATIRHIRNNKEN